MIKVKYALVGTVFFFLTSCSQERDIMQDNSFNNLYEILDYATEHFNPDNNSHLYHYQNIFNLAFYIMYKAKEKNFIALKEKLLNKLDFQRLLSKSEDTKSRLAVLQFSYLLSLLEKYEYKLRFQNNKKSIDYLNKLLKKFWLDQPAWHWKKTFPNMRERTLAKITHSQEISGDNYYYAIIDEDIFLYGIAANLITIDNAFDSSLLEILYLGYNFIKQKTNLSEGFSFSKGDWYEHPEFAYAGCETEEFPTVKCLKEDIEPDISHFHRMPWIINDLKEAFYYIGEKERAIYLKKWLDAFSLKFNNSLIFYTPEGYPLLKNFICGTNGWYRVGYHEEYDKFGYGPYELTLISVLGSYYLISEHRFIEGVNRALKSDSFKYKFYDEKYPTTFTQTLKDFGIFDVRFKYYTLLNEAYFELIKSGKRCLNSQKIIK